MRTGARGRGNRRGFTLILMTLLLTVFIGAAAFATDFGRMYLIHGQLQAAADAAALAAVYEVAQGSGSTALATAQAYGAKHKVGTALYPAARVVANPGTWSGTTFTPNGGNWTATTVDAVQVIVNTIAGYNFGRFFGFTSKTLYDTAVAVRGSVNTSTCVRPWAVPYQALLDVLDPTLTPSYNLTAADINTIRGYSTVIEIKVGSAGGLTQHGEFYATRLPPKYYADGTPGATWTGGNDYSDAISDTCTQLQAAMVATGASRGASVSVGDYLSRSPVTRLGQRGRASDDLCGSDTCSPPIKVAVALWDVKLSSPCDCYHVKYIGAFAVTGWDQPSKSVQGIFHVDG